MIRFGKVKLWLRARSVAVVLLFGLALGDGLGQLVRDFLAAAPVRGAMAPLRIVTPARPAWATASVRQVSSAVTLGPADACVVVNAASGPVTVTLPPVPAPGQIVWIKKADATANCVLVASDDLIDGCKTYVITTQWQSVVVAFDGKTWQVN